MKLRGRDWDAHFRFYRRVLMQACSLAAFSRSITSIIPIACTDTDPNALDKLKEIWIFVIIIIPSPMPRFNSRRASPELYPNSLYCARTTPTQHAKCLSRCTRLGYITGRLASVKNLYGTINLRVRNLSTLHHVYILREGTPPTVTTIRFTQS